MKTLVLSFLLGAASLAAADTTPAPTPQVTPRHVLAQPDLKTPLGKEWSAPRGKWTPADGVLTGAQIPAQKHPEVLRLTTGPAPMIVECEFRFNKAKSFIVGCNGAKGHIGRVTVSPTLVDVAANPVVAAKTTNHILAKQTVALKPTDWQHLRVEYAGDKMAAWLNQTALQGEDAFLATPKVTWFFAGSDGLQIRKISITQGTAK
jgi:hypothetical protein